MLSKSSYRRDEGTFSGKTTEPEIALAVSRVSPTPSYSKADEEKMHVFWRVFGGAIVSVTALVGLTLYNNVQSGIVELRSEMAKNTELRAELIRKDEFNTRMSASYERINGVMTQTNTLNATVVSLKTDLDSQKERIAKTTLDLDGTRKDNSTAIEVVKKDVAALETIKEKLAMMTLELKAAREESLKARAEVEKNQLADQARKQFRDDQHRDFEKVIKELQTQLQECQLKLARLEGQQQAAPGKLKETP
ncbi:hypothetical protein BH11PLA2_BH11PLA2_30410 [soil metagenome]